MKNSALTKSLLCGVMATTFFLINCQKAPNRGIKANGGSSGATADAAQKAAMANEILVDCPATFADKYKATMTALDALQKENLEGLDKAQQAALVNRATDTLSKAQDAVAEITKVKADATGCVMTDEKTKKQSHYINVNITDPVQGLILKLKEKGFDVDEKTVAGAEAAKKANAERKAKREAQIDVSGLMQGMSFIVSDEMAKVLISDYRQVAYFKDGQIIKEVATEVQAKDKADRKISLCDIGEGTSNQKIASGAKTSIFNSPSVVKDKASGRYKVSVMLASGSESYALDCTLADGTQTNFASEVRRVLGNNLKVYTQVKAQSSDTTKGQSLDLTSGKPMSGDASRVSSLDATKIQLMIQSSDSSKAQSLDLSKAKVQSSDSSKAKVQSSDSSNANAQSLDASQAQSGDGSRAPSSDEQPTWLTEKWKQFMDLF